MASVCITHQWDDGSVTEVTVEVDDGYPDSLGQARAVAVRTLAEVLAGFE